MDNKFLPSEKVQARMFLIILPVGMMVLSLTGGLWWLSGDLSKGIIALVSLTVFTLHNGLNIFKNGGNKKYFYIIFLLPLIVSLLLFSYGFFR